MIFNYIGNFTLLFSLIISLIIFITSILSLSNKSFFLKKKLNELLFFKFFFALLSFFSLIILFINSELSNETVLNNSHISKPLFYKISGTWGNHEGSLLLWLLILTFFAFFYFIKSKNRPLDERLLTIMFQEIIILGFLFFLLKASNPFNVIYPVPKEGLGLNPILQDPLLAIHPPVLYLGYVTTSIVFSSSLAGLIKGSINSFWAKDIRKWVFISWTFLTLGILLGSIWAYYELGWGGFWFWDPVENISLMPWLSLTALVHCVLVLEKRSILHSWTVILSIITFTLGICGTFLVRSGILNSVHTFANDPERGLYILFFLFFLIFLSVLIYFIYEDKFELSNKNLNFYSKEVSIVLNNWFVMYFLSVVLVGTVYPIFLDVLSNEKISVGPPFFNKLIIPFLIPFLVFMSVGPNLKWIKSNNFSNKLKLIIIFILSTILSILVSKFFGNATLNTTILLAASFYLFFTTIKDFAKKDFKNYSQTISHFGFSLLVLSIILNSIFSNEITSNMRVGDEIKFNDKSIKLQKLENTNEVNFLKLIAYFKIEEKDKTELILEPEIRIYDKPETITSEAAIKTDFFKDRFLVVNLVKENEYLNVRYQEKPFMLWIWISAILISLGGIINIYKKNEKQIL